jgi:uncharacterized membrane protein YfcA
LEPERLLIYLAVTAFSATMALVLFVLALYMMRRARKSRRREARLESAFERAKDRRVYGTVRLGSRYGVYGEKVLRASAMR